MSLAPEQRRRRRRRSGGQVWFKLCTSLAFELGPIVRARADRSVGVSFEQCERIGLDQFDPQIRFPIRFRSDLSDLDFLAFARTAAQRGNQISHVRGRKLAGEPEIVESVAHLRPICFHSQEQKANDANETISHLHVRSLAN